MSEELIRQMFKHLVKVYTKQETVEILSTKFPEAVSYIESIDVDSFEADVKPVKSYATPKPPKPEKVKRVSKQVQAQIIYDNSEDKSRQTMIKLFIKELGLAETSASNYYHSCRKGAK